MDTSTMQDHRLGVRLPAVGSRRMTAILVLRVAVPAILSIALFTLAVFLMILPAFERGLMARKQEMMRQLTSTVHVALMRYEERAEAGEFSQAEAQRRAIAHVRSLRYGDDERGYFWISDVQARMIMHPYRPDLEGQNLTEYTDPTGKHLFVEFVRAVERDGDGLVDYLWQWNEDRDRIVPKLSYVRLFKPWGWIVGTGIYLDDVAAETHALTHRIVWTTLVVLAIAMVLSVIVIGQSSQFESGRRRAIAALEVSEEKYRVLIESMTDGLAVLDEAGLLQFVNPRFCEMLGRTQDELLGQPVVEFLTERGRATHAAQMEFRRRGEAEPYEQTWQHKDGHEVATIISPQALTGSEGVWRGSFGVVTDISERKRAEAALRESEARYRQLIEMSPMPILVHWDQRILFANPAAVEVLGGTAPDDLVGRSVWDVVHQDSLETVRGRVGQLYDGQGSVDLAEEKFARLDGEPIDVECTANAVDFAGQRSVQVVFRDVTARKRAEQERAALAEQLNQAQKMEAVGQLAGGVAHDFNNLLTVITARVEQLRESDLPPEEAGTALRAIEDAVEQASGVTRALLTFSHKLPTDKQPVNLCEIVTRSGQLLKRLLPASIEMNVDAKCDPAPWVHADGTQLQQVVLNLAINARDAMAGGGGTLRLDVSQVLPEEEEALTLEGCHSWPAAILRVSDTGVGMSPEVQKRACEPFFTTKERGQGTGLGLAIVHGIVRDHGGCIRIESLPGEGTTVAVILPMTKARPHTVDVDEPVTPWGNGEVLLLAEDNRHAREIIASQLISLGYNVTAVGDGLAAWNAYNELAHVDLLILDVDMPLLSGNDCLVQIRAAGGRTPAILMTGSVDARIEDDLDEFTTLLRKPFNMATLGSRAATMLQRVSQEENDT